MGRTIIGQSLCIVLRKPYRSVLRRELSATVASEENRVLAVTYCTATRHSAMNTALQLFIVQPLFTIPHYESYSREEQEHHDTGLIYFCLSASFHHKLTAATTALRLGRIGTRATPLHTLQG